ncbi:MAG: ankyrin repeat domain-containing protein [Gammaproteobacteria bacterium]|nr:ankyrin repeat domain-containing protein [Gammaproteobacteria bacterium]
MIRKDSRTIYDRDESGGTMLHKFASLGEHECLQLILETHMKNNLPDSYYVDCTDGAGRTALHHAAMSGVPACIKRLLDNNAVPEAADSDGKRPRDVIGIGRDIGPYGFQVDIEACHRLLLPHEQT